MPEPTVDSSHVLIALRAAKRAVHVMEIVDVLGISDRGAGKARVRELLVGLCESGLAKELPGQKYRLGPGTRAAIVRPPEVAPGGRKRGGQLDEPSQASAAGPRAAAQAPHCPPTHVDTPGAH